MKEKIGQGDILKVEKVKIDGSAIAKIEDNTLNIFGQFSKIDDDKK